MKLKGASVGSVPPESAHYTRLSGPRRGSWHTGPIHSMMRGLTRGLGFISLSHLNPESRQSYH